MNHKIDNDIFWIHKPSVIWEKYNEFYPDKSMSLINMYNAITRFLIYSALLMLIFKMNVNLVLVVLILIGFIGILGKNLRTETPTKSCRDTTLDNPMANPMIIGEDLSLKACQLDSNKVEDYLRENLYEDTYVPSTRKKVLRAFYTLPVTDYPNDIEALGKFLYGELAVPAEQTCKMGEVNCESYRDVRFR